MKQNNVNFKRMVLSLMLIGAVLFFSAETLAQEEVASSIMRYKQYEVSTGYYEEYEARPQRQLPFVEIPGVRRGRFPYSPSGAGVRNPSRLADAHQGIRFYANRRCEACHIEQTKNIHITRANLTCRQCHGGEPIPSNQHYFSSMNPIRRHAYVCSKCHEGASASYAGYVVHGPNPFLTSTLDAFPALFYAAWIMVAIAVLTFAVFLPHTILWGLREFLLSKGGDAK